MAFDVISGLTTALVIITGYYALEVRKQTILFRKQTKDFLDDSKRGHLVDEITLLMAPLLRLERCFEINPYYWNWHDAIRVADGDLKKISIDNVEETNDIINNNLCYKYISSAELNSAITSYQNRLKDIEDIRGRYSKMVIEIEGEFSARDDVQSAYAKLKIAQKNMFKEAKKRYIIVQKMIKKLE